jgi:gluconate 2-dehydrogenase gamma chain
MTSVSQHSISRRALLLSSAAPLWTTNSKIYASTITGMLPRTPNAGSPSEPIQIGPWHFFKGAEGAAMDALADRIIPPDVATPGGKDSGSAIFVDRQLAGPYGAQEGHYLRPPFMKGVI